MHPTIIHHARDPHKLHEAALRGVAWVACDARTAAPPTLANNLFADDVRSGAAQLAAASARISAEQPADLVEPRDPALRPAAQPQLAQAVTAVVQAHPVSKPA